MRRAKSCVENVCLRGPEIFASIRGLFVISFKLTALSGALDSLKVNISNSDHFQFSSSFHVSFFSFSGGFEGLYQLSLVDTEAKRLFGAFKVQAAWRQQTCHWLTRKVT